MSGGGGPESDVDVAVSVAVTVSGMYVGGVAALGDESTYSRYPNLSTRLWISYAVKDANERVLRKLFIPPPLRGTALIILNVMLN